MYYHTIRYILIELVILPPDNANVVVAEDHRVLHIIPRLVAATHGAARAERVPGIITSDKEFVVIFVLFTIPVSMNDTLTSCTAP